MIETVCDLNLVNLPSEDPDPRRSFYDLRRNASPHTSSTPSTNQTVTKRVGNRRRTSVLKCIAIHDGKTSPKNAYGVDFQRRKFCIPTCEGEEGNRRWTSVLKCLAAQDGKTGWKLSHPNMQFLRFSNSILFFLFTQYIYFSDTNWFIYTGSLACVAQLPRRVLIDFLLGCLVSPSSNHFSSVYYHQIQIHQYLIRVKFHLYLKSYANSLYWYLQLCCWWKTIYIYYWGHNPSAIHFQRRVAT